MIMTKSEMITHISENKIRCTTNTEENPEYFCRNVSVDINPLIFFFYQNGQVQDNKVKLMV